LYLYRTFAYETYGQQVLIYQGLRRGYIMKGLNGVLISKKKPFSVYILNTYEEGDFMYKEIF